MTDHTFSLSRRRMMGGASALLALSALVGPEAAQAAAAAYVLPEHLRPTMVRVQEGYVAGQIYIFSDYHYLYHILPNRQAMRYGVAVGEEGRQFKGTATIQRKVEWPSWTPTASMLRRRPDLYRKHAGGMKGGPGNPLGSRAMYLFKGSRDTLVRIHGTIAPQTIGHSVSNGCIRMVNEHVEDLYDRVPLGTRVIVA